MTTRQLEVYVKVCGQLRSLKHTDINGKVLKSL